MYQRVFRFIATAIGIAILSMLWFWLLFGRSSFKCAGQSLLVTGAGQFILLAIAWGIAMAAILHGPKSRDYGLLLWSFVLGSLFHTIHYVLPVWRTGVYLSLSALATMAIAQPLTLTFLRRLQLGPREFLRALRGSATLSLISLFGVGLTALLFLTMRCSTDLVSQISAERALTSSIGWYLLCGVLPSFITALIYASETQRMR